MSKGDLCQQFLSPQKTSRDLEGSSLAHRVQKSLIQAFGKDVYQDWFSKVSFLPREEVGCFYAPSAFVKDWIYTHYKEPMERLFQKNGFPIKQVQILWDDLKATPGSLFPELPESPEKYHGETLSPEPEEDVTSFLLRPFDLNPSFTFENFVVGKPNEFAFSAAKRVAESDQAIYNPLFLYGPVGHGKTHLMHSIAHHIFNSTDGAKKKICYLTAEKFMYHFIRAIRYRDTVAFKEKFRSVDVLMIDDVQFISGKESTQEELFHTFNALVEQKKQVIFSADQSPSDLDGIQERMRSRLGWGLVADLHPTTYELRMGILQKKAESYQVAIEPSILNFLAQKISSSVRELEGALNRLAAHAFLVGRSITFDMTQEVLKDLLRFHTQEISIESIQKRVAEYYGIRLNDLLSTKRLRSIARPRQIAMFFSKLLTSCSLPEIGRKFAGRDHSTVLHGFKTIEQLKTKDPQINHDLEMLQRILKSA